MMQQNLSKFLDVNFYNFQQIQQIIRQF